MEHVQETINTANNDTPKTCITYMDNQGNVIFTPDKTLGEIKEIIDSGFEHYEDNQNRMKIEDLMREENFTDLETMINNKDSRTLDESELSEIEKSKLGEPLDWNCD